MIIWLASYPKSGNTLLRSLLGTYFFSPNGEFDFKYIYKIQQFPAYKFFKNINIDIANHNEIFKNYIRAQDFINQKYSGINFLKTHAAFVKIQGCNFTDLKNTLGAIYIVRDPRNVAISFAHHYTQEIDYSVNDMIYEKANLVANSHLPHTFISSWGKNYNSWKQLGNRVLIIKYEDLVNKKKETFIKILNFLNFLGIKNLGFNDTKIDNLVKDTDFKKMKKLEKKTSFNESIVDKNTGKKKPFFYLGPNNDWKNILSNESKEKIENKFFLEMKELGYL